MDSNLNKNILDWINPASLKYAMPRHAGLSGWLLNIAISLKKMAIFNPRDGDAPIVKQWPGRKASLKEKKILERLVQAIDVIENPNKPG